MAGKARVHELARELGYDSKTVLAKLKELGEFVKSASSTIEPPVARRLREALPPKEGAAPNGAPAKPKPGPAARSVEESATAPPAPAASAERVEDSSGGGDGTISTGVPSSIGGPRPGPPRPASRPAEPEAPAAAEATPEPAPAPRPAAGNNPFQAPPETRLPARPRPAGPPRMGNNPFMSREERTTAAGGEAPAAGPRPGGPRPPARPGAPNPGMMGSRPAPSGPPRPGMRSGGPGGPGGPGGARPGGPGGARPGAGAGARPGAGGRPGGFGGGPSSGPSGPGGGPSRPGGPPGRGGRAGGGGTAGAFGRGGGRPTRGRKSKKQRRQEFDNMQAPSIGGVQVPRGDGSTVVRLARGASLTDFAEKINANPASLVTVLFHLGEMATATQSLDEETFGLLGAELGYDVQIVSPEDEDRALLESFDMNLDDDADDEAALVARPPVVTVMGHVDHGKTRLLDAIRKVDTLHTEAGGITQHIGAYQVHYGDRALTFIDTPGHEAFTAMRARGAKVTDIAVLVVAADDGVMPQTIEALNHAQAADVPIVVAVNKVDVEGADPARIRQQLTEYNLVAEEYGGETMFVDVSAKQGQNIDALLEAVLLTADAALELTANADAPARGVAIEGHLDRGRGPVATVLVQRGTLRVGDSIVAGDAFGRVRAMLDEHGEQVQEAEPSRPVQVLGLTSVPGAGDKFLVTTEDRVARQIAERRSAMERNALLAKARKRVSLEDLTKILEQGKIETLNLILKGDVSGSVEALEESLLQLDVGELVELRIIHRGVGAITKNDVTLASASDAIIIGFNVRPEGKVGDLAEREGIDVRFYSVIYAAIEEVEAALKGMLKPEYEEAQLGTAEIREVFRSSKFGNIAGSIVRSGEIRRNTKARLLREGVVIGDNLTITSLKRFKDDATEVREGFECGIGLGSHNDIRVGDTVETFEMREKPRA